jgi:hypothetical protein
VKIEVIGEDQVVERGPVAVELFFVARFFGSFEVFVAEVFGLDETDGDFFVGEDIVGCAAGLPFGFVGGPNGRHEAFEELLEVAAEGVFGGVSEAVALLDAEEVLFYCHVAQGGKFTLLR